MKLYTEGSVGIQIPIPENYRDCIKLLQSDYYRCHGRTAGLIRMYLYGLKEPAFKFLFWHRLSQVHGWLYYFAKWRHRHYLFKYSIYIASDTKIGYGLFIGHPCGIIINHTAIIGNNVNLSQFTTIGSNEKNAAVVGDNVYIGPSCCLIENVHVGCNATIGAGAIVTHDIPANAVCAGNPAKPINSKVTPGKYINNKWPLDKTV